MFVLPLRSETHPVFLFFFKHAPFLSDKSLKRFALLGCWQLAPGPNPYGSSRTPFYFPFETISDAAVEELLLDSGRQMYWNTEGKISK